MTVLLLAAIDSIRKPIQAKDAAVSDRSCWQAGRARMGVLARIVPIVLSASISAVAGCSVSTKPKGPAVFVGHAIGEGSGAWAANEPNQAIDPLSRCQQIVRSTVLDQSLPSAQKCREFVNNGSYVIDATESGQPMEKVFQFTNWRVSAIVLKYASGERTRVVRQFDSRFLSRVPGQLWVASGREAVEIRPIEQLETFTGTPDASDAFLVVVSDKGK
jgi:hypothetical protein